MEAYRMFAKLKQIGWSALFGVLVATQALGQTATLLPNAKQQFFDNTGAPLAAGKVDFFIPSTNTRKTTWVSSVESTGTQNTNPVLLDAGGRATIYGDGVYRQRVTDASGNTIWDAVTSSTGNGSGGGGSATIGDGLAVGTILGWSATFTPPNYLYTAGQAVSRTAFPTLFTNLTIQANILCQTGIATITVTATIATLVPIGAPVEAGCFAPGTTVIAKGAGQLTLSTNATITISTPAIIFPWGNGDGSTTFNVPDFRGRAPIGRDNMASTGGAGHITQAFYGANPDALNAVGGSQSQTLTATNVPTIVSTNAAQPITVNPSNNPGLFGAVSSGTISATSFTTATIGSGPVVPQSSSGSWSGTNAFAANNAISVTSTGTNSQPFATIQPSVTSDYIIKVLPDSSISISSCLQLADAGTACQANTGTSGHTIPYLDGTNTWSGANAFTTATFTSATMTSATIGGGSITGMPSPTHPSDVATKAYVDASAIGLIVQPASALATAAVLPNTPTYANGTLGVGATLTAGSNTTLTVDSASATLNTVVLVKNQASAFQNGIYTVTQAGSGSVPWILTRATYFDQASEMLAGSYTTITGGVANINTAWVLQATVTTVGTTAANFNMFTQSVATVPGVLTNVLSTQTLPFSITNSNTPCGSTVNVAGGPGTLTLSSVSGFASTCAIQACNTAPNDNSHNGIILSGFPNPSLPHLWMGQCETVQIVNGAWQVRSFPGKFAPGFIMTCFVDTGGSNANDGLVSNASTTAVVDPQQCVAMWNSEISLNGSQPTIMLTNGQTNPQSGGAGALTLVGGEPKVVFVQGNGGNATLQNTGGTVVAAVQDFGGYFIFVNVTLDCTNASAHPCFSLFMHQQSGADLNANVILKGASSTDTGIECDSFCKINGNNIVTVSGTLSNAFEGNQGSAFKFSNGIATASGTTIVHNMFLMSGNSSFNYSGPMTAGSSTSVNTMYTGRASSNFCIAQGAVTGTFTGLTQWSILGNSVFTNLTSTAVPGGAGSNTAAGFAPGIIGAATNGGC